MGTSIEVELHAASRADAEVAIAAVMSEMRRIDATMSPHKVTSELSIVNAHAADGPVTVSEGMFGLLSRAVAFSKTVFVLGVEEGLRFVEAHAGVDAVIVDAQGALHYSAGLLG